MTNIKKCIMCGCEVIQNPCATNMNGKGYRNAIVGNITANYGSAYIGMCFSVAICDWCINANMDKLELIHENNNLYELLKRQYKDATDKGIHIEFIELTQSDIDLLQIELADLIDVYAKMQIGQVNTLNYVLKRIALPNIKLIKQ